MKHKDKNSEVNDAEKDSKLIGIIAIMIDDAPQVDNLSKLNVEEIEDQLHNSDQIKSALVLEEEIKILTMIMNKSKELKDFYKEKIESLEFNKSMIENGIYAGTISIDK